MIEHRLVMDGQTERHRPGRSIYHASIASRGKNVQKRLKAMNYLRRQLCSSALPKLIIVTDHL